MRLEKVKQCNEVGMAYGVNVKALAVGEVIDVPQQIAKELLKLKCFKKVTKDGAGNDSNNAS